MPKLFCDEAIDEIARQKKGWKEKIYRTENERLKTFETLSGIAIDPIYTPAEVTDLDYTHDLGLPGQAPFTRGVYPTMYRGRVWTLRQLAGYGPPEQTNQRYKLLLAEGATGINGVGGVAVDTLEDMRALFDGIPIQDISTSLVTCQPICNISIQSMYFADASLKGIPLNRLTGTSQNDFLMETAITIAPEVLPPRFSFKLCCDAIEYCAQNVPRWNPVSFAGYNYREAGCTAAQEVAFVIANAVACTDELIRRGHDVDSFASRLSFFLSAHSDFFEEIAKYRAARRIWHRVMRDRFSAKDARSLAFRFHVQTAGVALTAQQPLNNIARAAYHGLSAVLGGAQSVHIDGYDEALCTPTELSAITALRTNQILQLETRVTHTIDPLGGSYFVESLTNQLEDKIESVLSEIDRMGGLVNATESGWVHREISNSAYDYQRKVESGEIPIVGVNFSRQEDEELPIELFEVPETLSIQKKKLAEIMKKRDASKVARAIDDIARCCDEDGNLMEVIVDAAKALVSEGEISRTIKGCYGTWDVPLF